MITVYVLKDGLWQAVGVPPVTPPATPGSRPYGSGTYGSGPYGK